VNNTAGKDTMRAGWPLGVFDAGHNDVAGHAWPGTARPGRQVPDAVVVTTSGQRPADADTLTAGHDPAAGHTTSQSWPR
jgi:hypothetical protein